MTETFGITAMTQHPCYSEAWVWLAGKICHDHQPVIPLSSSFNIKTSLCFYFFSFFLTITLPPQLSTLSRCQVRILSFTETCNLSFSKTQKDCPNPFRYMCEEFMNSEIIVFYFRAIPENLGYTSKTGRMYFTHSHIKNKQTNHTHTPFFFFFF